jgi:hypothetical protein
MGSIAKIGLTPTTQGKPGWNDHIDDGSMRVVIEVVKEAWDWIVFPE